MTEGRRIPNHRYNSRSSPRSWRQRDAKKLTTIRNITIGIMTSMITSLEASFGLQIRMTGSMFLMPRQLTSVLLSCIWQPVWCCNWEKTILIWQSEMTVLLICCEGDLFCQMETLHFILDIVVSWYFVYLWIWLVQFSLLLLAL